MAESTLSLQFKQFHDRVSMAFGYGKDYALNSPEQQALVEFTVERGLRQFYFPPVLEGERQAHEWSFMTPVTFIDTNAPYATGSVSISAAGVVTNSGNHADTLTWPSWAADGTLIYDSKRYTVASRDSDTQITLDDTSWTAVTGSTTVNYELVNEDYDLPDNFGGIIGDLTFNHNSNGYGPIRVVGEEQIRKLRNQGSGNFNSWPRFAAVRPRDTAGTAGQRFELMLWPAPDAAYIIEYKYNILLDDITSTNIYPVGGMQHAETILASCLDMAEQHMRQDRGLASFGVEHERFMQRLRTSVYLDRQLNATEYFGYNGDNSGALDKRGILRDRRSVSVTYNDVLYGPS